MIYNAIKLTKITGLALLAAALLAAPALTRADISTNTPAAQTPAPKKHGLPFHGKVAAADAAAMTFTVGTLTFGVTSSTKLTKDGKPAVFADITVGQNVSGSYKKDDAGKLIAASVKIGVPKKKNAPSPAPATSAQ
jgi:hypothetical protein